MLKRILFLLTVMLLASNFIYSQVTGSSITGFVRSDKGTVLEGATVTAIHQPSGTKYVTISKKDGSFTIPNAKAGGPYSLTVSYAGFNAQTINDITLELGTPFTTEVDLSTKAANLSEVVITTAGRNRLKTGASTNISPRMIQTLPTISNSITDFTRLTPQANPSNNSFAGRDGRYNNVTVDGANLNNNFGLSTDPLPGGGANPIPIDAIQEISVNIAPYDVRQAQFTGANIAAVTKSGTNTFHGSAYTYYRNQKYQGLTVGDFRLPQPANSYNKIYGASLGGPIIKNKLFFFLNGEYEETSSILAYYIPAGGTGIGNQSVVPIDSLRQLSDYLKSKYGYDPGPYDNFNTSVPQKNHKYIAKLDWNISDVHKLTVRYSELKNDQTFLPSQSGGINGANSQSSLFTYGPKFSTTAMAFGYTAYTQSDKVKTASLDFTSNFHGRASNQFLATFSKINVDKAHLGAQFPFADIAGNPTYAASKQNYLSFGNEPFNGNYNVVVNDVYTITDNYTYYRGKHTITAGASYEFQKVGNGFMAGSQGYYAYGSLSDFLNNRAPKMFSITYSLIPGQDGVISANLKVGQLGVYVQDDYNVSPNLKITAGLRIDRPVYPEQPLANNAVNNLPLYDKGGNVTTYNTGSWPTATFYWSPRAGFRYNIPSEKLIVRGGTGLYTGRVPFVWLTNLPTGVGPYQFGTLVTVNTAGIDMNNFKFNPDPHAYNPFYNSSLPANLFPTKGGTAVPTGAYALIDNNFKFPQVWRTDLAFDKQIGTWGATIEAVYSKDVNSVYMFNANQKAPDATVNLGGGVTRPSYSNTTTARKLNSGSNGTVNSGNAVVLTNSSKGQSFAFTTQISKSFASGFYGQLSYTYTFSQDITANPGSQANSVWSANPTSVTQNTIELAPSSFSIPHRVMAYMSYRREYLKHLATTVGLYYEGAAQGRLSYIYNGDVNNDGNSADLMYIPKDPSEINFVPIAASGSVPGFTAQQQKDAFFAFIAQDKYLSAHMGQNAERNGAVQPWYNRVDVKFSQEIFHNFGKGKHTLSFDFTVNNFLNMINHNWGIKSFFIVSNPLKVVTPVVNSSPTFQLATYLPQGATQQILLDRTYINNNSLSSTWRSQIGLHYSF